MESEKKVTISRKKIENVKIEYNGVEIEVYPYIDFEIEAQLIIGYISQYFFFPATEEYPKWNDSLTIITGKNIWYADYFLKQSILEELTNVDTVTLSTEDTLDLYEIVNQVIINRWQFEERLFNVVNDVKEELASRKSLGVVIDKTVNKLSEFLDSIQSIDPKALKELADTIIEKVKNSDVAPIFAEATQQAAIENTKQTKTKKVKEPKA